MAFNLSEFTKTKVLDVRVLAAKDRKPDDPPGAQLLLQATMPAAVLAMFDGFLPGMLFRKAGGGGSQSNLEGMEGDELTGIGDHVQRLRWQYEQTGCTVEIDYGRGGKSNIVLSDCKVHRVSMSPRQGGSVVVQWTVDAPGLGDAAAWSKLANMKATEIQLKLLPPKVDDSQGDIDDDPPAPAPTKAAKSAKSGEASKAALDASGKSPFPAKAPGATEKFVEAHGQPVQ